MQRDKVTLKFNELAPDMEVQTTKGDTILLSSLWKEKPLLLAFTRHFGCPQCKEMLSKLSQERTQLENAGFSMVIVTQGKRETADEFCAKHAPGILCLSDPNRLIYRAFGLGRGSLTQTVLSWRVWRENNRVKKEKGWNPEMPPQGQDAMLMSGLFIIGSDGHIRLPYYYDDIADHPPLELLLKGFLNTGWEKPFNAPLISE